MLRGTNDAIQAGIGSDRALTPRRRLAKIVSGNTNNHLRIEMTTEYAIGPLPSLAELVGVSGLYARFSIADISPERLSIFSLGITPSDLYCIDCKRMSVFRSQIDLKPVAHMIGHSHMGPFTVSMEDKPKTYKHEHQTAMLDMVCSRDVSHKIKVIFRITENTLTKIGQYPSLADLQLHQISKYDGVLIDQMRRDFARAIGLNAHGIGIGAFVYLRRIFESLIEEAHEESLTGDGWDEGLFQRSRMDDRIKMLKHLLPEILVSNASIYSILSKGIHMLTDEECLEYYTTIKMGIELILDEKIKHEQEQSAKKQLSSEIGRIQSKLKQ